MNESLGKEYKLCSKKAIDRLFKEGNSFRCDGLRFIYVYHAVYTVFRIQYGKENTLLSLRRES